jgi:hypothetical protein
VQARPGLRVAVRHGELQVGGEDGDPVDERGALEGVHQPFVEGGNGGEKSGGCPYEHVHRDFLIDPRVCMCTS